MKKICLMIATFLLMGTVSVNAESDVSVIAEYTAAMKSEQGVNNWQYVFFTGDDYKEMYGYNTTQNAYGRWNGDNGSKLQVDGFSPGTVHDVGFVFKAPMKGVIRISGTAKFNYSSAAQGDGCIVSIEKGGAVLWKDTVTYATPKDYSVEIPIKTNERIFVRINKNKNDAYDQLNTWPKVEYLAKAFTGGGTEGYKYLERRDGVVTELTYSKEDDRFNATDGTGFLSDDVVLPSEKCSMIKRYTITEDGRYRIYGNFSIEDRRGGGNLVYIYKNDELLWQQLVPEAQTEQIDIRVEAKTGDIIDVEVKNNEFEGFNNMKWEYKITKFDGVLPFAKLSAGSGYTYGVDEEFTLSSKIGTNVASDTKIYGLWLGKEYPMTYDSAKSNWKAQIDTSNASTISGTVATLGNGKGDVGVDLTLKKTGVFKIQGEFAVNESTNGALVEIYKNGEKVWINREGGDNLGRYDDPYDKNYFQNKINLTLNVNEGDKLTLIFSGWIKYAAGNTIDFSKVSFKYINGNVLSKTTKWKLGQSIVIDTLTSKAYFNGEVRDVKLINKNGSNFMSEDDTSVMFGSLNGVQADENGYIPIRAALEANKKNVSWTANRLIIIYEGLPMIYTAAEYSEISAALKGGDLF